VSLVVGVVVAIAVAIGGTLGGGSAIVRGGERAAASPGATDRLSAVQSVLDARVRALGGGDRNAWLASVDPRASEEFRAAQVRIFDGLRVLPVERFALEARVADSGDLATGLDTKYGAPVFLPETRQHLRFRGYDDTDEVSTLWLTFVQRDGEWYVAGDEDLASLGLDTARGPWEFGAVEVVEGPHLLVLFHPAQRERAAAIAGIAEEAMQTLASRWDQPWSGKIPVVLPANTTELEALLQSTIDLDKFVAFVSYGSLRDVDWQRTAPRVYIQDANLAGYGRAFQVETLLHELSHAAAAPVAGPAAPSWVHEGLADWIATGRSLKERKPKGSDGVLPRDHEFSTGSQDAIVRSYRESRSAFSYLAATHGNAAATTFFRALGEPRSAPGSVDFQVDAALRRAAGVGLTDFQRAWAAR